VRPDDELWFMSVPLPEGVRILLERGELARAELEVLEVRSVEG